MSGVEIWHAGEAASADFDRHIQQVERLRTMGLR
jgi:hypothetical protein